MTAFLIILGFTYAMRIGLLEGGARSVPTTWDYLTLWDSGLFIGGNIPESAYFQKSVSTRPDFSPWEPDVIIITELFKFIVAIILLNLLIAIMNSVYEAILVNVDCVFLYEKSRVILDIQSLWLPIIQFFGRRPKSFYFPRWLFVLAPAADDARRRPSAAAR